MVCLGTDGTGDGFNMATAVGAIDDLANASQYLPHYPTFPVTDYKADPYNPINGLGGIATGDPIMWVNETIDRFVREDTTSVMAPSSASIATKRNAATYPSSTRTFTTRSSARRPRRKPCSKSP